MATLPEGDDEPRLHAWERRADWWLTGLAVVFLAAYAWQVLDTSLGPTGWGMLEAVMTASWLLFCVDYVVRLVLARRKWRFVRTHLLDLAILLLPLLRQLRALRVITALVSLNRQMRNDVRGRVLVYVIGTVALIGFVAALAVLDAERGDPEAKIVTFGDAVWWTITTISTVGYGDLYPVTDQGRLMAACLMLAGIALLGVVTASIASWFVESLRNGGQRMALELDQVNAEMDRTEAQMAIMVAELRKLNARLDDLEQNRSSGP